MLPYEYMETVGISLCNDCTVIRSGHANCQIPNCQDCLHVAENIAERGDISKQFQEGTLIIGNDPALSNDVQDGGQEIVENDEGFIGDEKIETTITTVVSQVVKRKRKRKLNESEEEEEFVLKNVSFNSSSFGDQSPLSPKRRFKLKRST